MSAGLVTHILLGAIAMGAIGFVGGFLFPIFCFLITEGYQYTQNVKKYLIRLFIFALLSEIIVDKIFFGSYFYIESQNIFFTLLIGLLTIVGMDYCQQFSDKIKEKIRSNSPTGKFFDLILEFILKAVVLILAILTALIIKPEYGLLGLAMILAFYLFKNKPVLIILSSILISILYFEWVQLFACLALVPILLYNGKEGRKIKYFFYTYYPIHLIIIFLISFVIVGGQIQKFEQVQQVDMPKTIETKYIENQVTSDIISSESLKSVNAKLIKIIQVNHDSTIYTIPSFSIANGEMVIFTRENNEGWQLNSGDAFSTYLDFVNKNENNTEKIKIVLGVVMNKEYLDLNTSADTHLETTISAFQDGEYYMAIRNESSYQINAENGKIIIKEQ
jgi:hypothetical protein